MFTQTCTIRRRGDAVGEDRYHSQIFGPPVEVEAPCWWEPATTEENIISAEQYTLFVTAYLPLSYRAQVDGCDSISIDGRTYDLVGRPQIQPDGFAVEGYVKATLREVTG